MKSTERESNKEKILDNRSTKKVHPRGREGDTDVIMEAILALEKPRSWKDYLVGTGFQAERKAATAYNFDDDGDFELLYADVVRSSINDIPSINFYERVKQILIKDMAYTVGPWIVYGKYLTVQPWSMLFTALLECGNGMDSPFRSAKTYVQKENPMGNRGMI
ncbi:hypothetical protein Godav_019458, partial [Gossypium davidsonii]|nr:hypothetical protein [Gossypium davidsonii]